VRRGSVHGGGIRPAGRRSSKTETGTGP
jgi:hypothetical protein